MGVTWKLFAILCVFCLLASGGYILWGVLDHTFGNDSDVGGWEPVGVLGLALVGGLCGLIAFYTGWHHRAQRGVELPEDRPDALIDDGEAEQGFFSPWSWWPITAAAGASLVFLGLAVGFWVAFIGAVVAVLGIIGWIYEYYRGNFAH